MFTIKSPPVCCLAGDAQRVAVCAATKNSPTRAVKINLSSEALVGQFDEQRSAEDSGDNSLQVHHYKPSR